ncbi:MAG: hypothetical protein DRP01_05210 [Archaeoglobales archaeon]|nr:MAG: hypothetical protein DRP01_05210 [Archaeoglobales archaeon]
MRYFRYSLTFAFGIGLLLIGLTFITYFQLRYTSNPFLIEITFSLIGLGVPLTVQGISGMFGYVRYSKLTGIVGFSLCVFAVLSFLILFPENWTYPNVSIVATAYAFGLVFTFGGLFAEVVQRSIESREKTEEVKEEIEDLTFFEPVNLEPEITIKDFDLNVKGVERIGKVIKVKDNVEYDASLLNRVREGKLEVRMKDKEISEISKILRDMEDRIKRD